MGKLTADEPSCFKRHSALCLADFSRNSNRLMLSVSFFWDSDITASLKIVYF